MKQLLVLFAAGLLAMCRTALEAPPPPTPVIAVPRILITKPGVYDGKMMGISPGDTVAVQAGEYTYFRFKNFMGSPTRPVVFLNYGGQVRVNSSVAQLSNVTFAASRYVVLNGQGDHQSEYGFRISAPAVGVSALAIGGKSSDVEVHHVEIDTAGFAGIMAKTDPAVGDSSTWRGNFTMYNVLIHHNYVHDTRAKGCTSVTHSGMKALLIRVLPYFPTK
ncbi:right-handed parallel beta-helix repeat-containing protein [Spirosoma rhododendri]|uniref:Uncharacterized protein n=1 Tax=Spirosoma rhododendri TaxID=2728024 RepID=A0A7L5DFT2_9BACT|nr:hypothetical protein [Spirosoma rhododendri]QJD77014.1 hypothetical protein HH216_00225 [Spirosoma rhododendri]